MADANSHLCYCKSFSDVSTKNRLPLSEKVLGTGGKNVPTE
jgi:hypothetical protein